MGITVTGAGSVYRIHMKAAAPTDYRSAFLSPVEQKTLAVHSLVSVTLGGKSIAQTNRDRPGLPLGNSATYRLIPTLFEQQ